MKSARLLPALAGAGNVLAFFVTFGLMCWVLRSVLPFPQVPVVHVKVAHLAKHIDDYDTLFIGSSRIYRHVVPALFDQLMAQKGASTHSFNAGVDGMRPPEDAYLLDQILSFQPKNLRFVFVELGGLRLLLDEDKKGTIRSVYWHDWERLKLMFQRAVYRKEQKKKKKREVMDTLKELREPLGIFADHLTLFVQNITNLGRAEAVMSHLRGRSGEVQVEALIGKRHDGYVAANIPQEMPDETRAEYESTLAERTVKPAARDLADPVSQAALARMIAKIEKIGAVPVLIVPPTTNAKNFVPAADLAHRLLVFDFSDVQRYPALFENRHRQDTNHVNAAGAEVFTRLLVDEFVPHMPVKR